MAKNSCANCPSSARRVPSLTCISSARCAAALRSFFDRAAKSGICLSPATSILYPSLLICSHIDDPALRARARKPLGRFLVAGFEAAGIACDGGDELVAGERVHHGVLRYLRGRRPRDAAEERDLAEVIARTHHAAAVAVDRDGDLPGVDHVEPVAELALADDRRPLRRF